MKETLRRLARRYLIDAMSAMAFGLFASLLIGTIFKALGMIPGLQILDTIGAGASAVAGPAMAVAIAYSLKASPLVVYSCAAVGWLANSNGGAGGPLAVLIIAIIAAEVGMLVSKKTKVDILVTPFVTLLVGGLLSVWCASYIGKAVDHEVEGPHAQIGADILRKHNEAKDVIHAVAAHHAEVEPVSLYDILINACDTLSASRPGARSETTELYLKRLEQLEQIAHDFPGVESCFALQAGREVRVVVMPEKISEGEAQILAKDICQRIEKEMSYPGQIKVTIIRETRSVEYAK